MEIFEGNSPNPQWVGSYSSKLRRLLFFFLYLILVILRMKLMTTYLAREDPLPEADECDDRVLLLHRVACITVQSNRLPACGVLGVS
jgi:hypothetical protein